MLHLPSSGKRRRTFFQVVGRYYDQTRVQFLIPDLDRDLPFGVYVTMAHARGHFHPEVRAWYDTVSRWFVDFEQLMQPWMQTRSKFNFRRLQIHAGIREPWETRTGYSAEGCQGSAVGVGALHRALIAFFESHPAILRDCAVEPDTLSMAEGFGMDRVSDTMIAVGKQHVIAFTKWCAQYYQFDPACLQAVEIKNVWQPAKGRFGKETHTVPVDDDGKAILLLPREIIRSAPPFSAAAYFRDVHGPDYSGPMGKRAVLADAAENPGRLSTFARDFLREPDRFKIRRDLRPPKDDKATR